MDTTGAIKSLFEAVSSSTLLGVALALSAATVSLLTRMWASKRSVRDHADTVQQLLASETAIVVARGTELERLITQYHDQALLQATVQFWFSVFAATAGFLIIIIQPFLASNVAVLDKLLGTLPGITIDLVAALFFRQAAETRKRATELYDRLRSDSQVARAAALLDEVPNDRIQSVARAQLALHMAGLPSTTIDWGTVLAQLIDGACPSGDGARQTEGPAVVSVPPS